eukprot:284816238_2
MVKVIEHVGSATACSARFVGERCSHCQVHSADNCCVPEIGHRPDRIWVFLETLRLVLKQSRVQDFLRGLNIRHKNHVPVETAVQKIIFICASVVCFKMRLQGRNTCEMKPIQGVVVQLGIRFVKASTFFYQLPRGRESNNGALRQQYIPNRKCTCHITSPPFLHTFCAPSICLDQSNIIQHPHYRYSSRRMRTKCAAAPSGDCGRAEQSLDASGGIGGKRHKNMGKFRWVQRINYLRRKTCSGVGRHMTIYMLLMCVTLVANTSLSVTLT